jgi:hypothetical protein
MVIQALVEVAIASADALESSCIDIHACELKFERDAQVYAEYE